MSITCPFNHADPFVREYIFGATVRSDYAGNLFKLETASTTLLEFELTENSEISIKIYEGPKVTTFLDEIIQLEWSQLQIEKKNDQFKIFYNGQLKYTTNADFVLGDIEHVHFAITASRH